MNRVRAWLRVLWELPLQREMYSREVVWRMLFWVPPLLTLLFLCSVFALVMWAITK